jgi:hypothetical protein
MTCCCQYRPAIAAALLIFESRCHAAFRAGEVPGQGLRQTPRENARSIRARFELTPNASLLGPAACAALGADA